MSFLRNTDVKNHLARAVPRSMTPATAAEDSLAEAAAIKPVDDEATERLAPAVEVSVPAEAPEKTRPM